MIRRILEEIERMGEPLSLLDPITVRTGIDRIHLEIALALHLHGSFRRAGEALNMKTSTISRRVRDLEFQLGGPIFERQKRRLVPTPSGRVFLRRSGEILTSFHALVEAVRNFTDGKAGQVTIGYYGSIAQPVLQKLLFDPETFQPDVSRVPVELPHDRMNEALAAGRIDLAIFRGKAEDISGQVLPLCTERLFVALAADHRLAERMILQWSDVADETFLLSGHHPSHAIRQLLVERLPNGKEPHVIVHDISAAAIMHMVADGRGISPCLESMLNEHHPGMVFRELRDATSPELVTLFAGWREDSINPALSRFMNTLMNQIGLGSDTSAARHGAS
ncbi:MAG: LysR family transcriptional regulator [Sphingobium limneticum]